MTQGVLPFKYEEEKKNFGTTALCGMFLFLDLLHKMGFSKIVSNNLAAKEDKQGWGDLQFLVCLILLNISGGDCIDDINHMENDDGLRMVLKHLELRSAFGRRREKLKRQWRWRNGKKNSLPSPSAIFRYLLLFHDARQESIRASRLAQVQVEAKGKGKGKVGKSFIPSSNAHLLGLSGINKSMLEFLQLNNPVKVATIDMDATVVSSNKKEALYSYKKIKSYQPLNVWWYEQNYMLHTQFRDGNVPAHFGQKELFIEALDNLPEGVEEVYLRCDTAGYVHELLKYCDAKENKPFGRIGFAIGCDVVDEFKKSVYEVKEEDWHPIYKEVNGELKETTQEWTELCYVPNEISRSKKGCYFRYLATRELIRQKVLPGEEMEELSQKSFSFPNVKLNDKNYKIYGIVTNLGWEGEKIIHWSRKRCGDSEHVHGQMKEEFCGGQLPSGKFGVNAAWWWIMVLSLNLTSIMKRLALSKGLINKRMKKIRFSIINIPGRVIRKGKELIVRLSKGHPGFDLLVNCRRRIARLGALSPG
jgi:hypothetical protein